MPSQIVAHELSALTDAANANKAGIELAQALKLLRHAAPRTVQRRLAFLVLQGQLIARGKGIARRYLAPIQLVEPALAEPTFSPRHAPPSILPLSLESAALLERLNRPLALRRPVAYQRDFLDQYVPNQTPYLPENLRLRLHEMGRSPVNNTPAGTYARQIMDRLLIDLSWSSSRLEGNTYSRLDTQNLIAFGHAAVGKDRVETQMVLNHKQAIEMLVEQADEIGFNRYTFQNLHALLSENLLHDPGAAGRLRRIEVAISGTVFQPLAIPQLIEECFDLLLAKADLIADPFEQAFFVMVQLPYLQPFEDVNKRVSRLGANVSLIKHNLAPLSFVDVPEREYVAGMLGVYELNRIELLREVFAWAYERSCQRYTAIKDSLPEPDPLRLRYRDTLNFVVAAIVRGGMPIDYMQINGLAKAIVAAADLEAFISLATNELYLLHEGNLARYRLRPLELSQWLAGRGTT
jgi:Fic family protein